MEYSLHGKYNLWFNDFALHENLKETSPRVLAFGWYQLLRLVTSHGSLAVVLDVPKYGAEAFDAPTLQHWCKRQASRFLFDSGKRDNRPEYRSRLNKLSDEIPNVALVEAARLPSFDDDRDLWRDPAHLNSEGYQVAAKSLAVTINQIYQIALARKKQQDSGGHPAPVRARSTQDACLSRSAGGDVVEFVIHE